MKKNLKKTRIVATIGPASENPVVLKKLIDAGLNVARMNFSHGDHVEHSERLEKIRKAMSKAKKEIAILQDLGGVKIRIGDFVDGSIDLKKGQKFIITSKKCAGNNKKVSINYKKLPKEVEVGQSILIDDGTKELCVTKTTDTEIETKVVTGGMIQSRRGVNVPGARLSCSALTAKDKKDIIEFGVKNNVDFIALSFVRSAKDVLQLRRILDKYKSDANIIAKIETPEAIENIDGIISVADGIMVARGDLAVEMPACDVPHLQKMIVKKCNIVGKPVIVATQMLESMITAPVPTRAEVTDVANAILDGADAVMLSAESAMGKYPLAAVRTMASIAKRTEKEISVKMITDIQKYASRTVNAVSRSAIYIAEDIGAVAIVALTESGFSARKISRYKPRQDIIALTPRKKTHQNLQLSYGCFSHVIDRFHSVVETVAFVKKFVKKNGYAKKGERVVIVAGVPFEHAGTTNMVIVEEV
ncbi:MAG: pyruvate kinase [Candidatus Moraniibacteriota bacterium]|nr:MAG: pyruvate kinase [Candidatus Moranbacteria bacterium]